MLPIIKSRDVPRDTKVMLYKTLIRSLATYECEVWSITQKNANTLDAFKRKILRSIYGPNQEESMWRIRYNHELYQLYKAPKLSTHISLMRLRWAEYVQRLDDGRIPKKVLTTSFLVSRPREKPRNRWENDVVADAKTLLHVNN